MGVATILVDRFQEANAASSELTKRSGRTRSNDSDTEGTLMHLRVPEMSRSMLSNPSNEVLDSLGLARLFGFAGRSAIHMRLARGHPLPPPITIANSRRLLWHRPSVIQWLCDQGASGVGNK